MLRALPFLLLGPASAEYLVRLFDGAGCVPASLSHQVGFESDTCVAGPDDEFAFKFDASTDPGYMKLYTDVECANLISDGTPNATGLDCKTDGTECCTVVFPDGSAGSYTVSIPTNTFVKYSDGTVCTTVDEPIAFVSGECSVIADDFFVIFDASTNPGTMEIYTGTGGCTVENKVPANTLLDCKTDGTECCVLEMSSSTGETSNAAYKITTFAPPPPPPGAPTSTTTSTTTTTTTTSETYDDPSVAKDTLAVGPTGELVPMASLKSGDLVMDGPGSFARVIVNQHRAVSLKSSLLEIGHASGEVSLTPDHVLEVDGAFIPARRAAVGSKLGESEVSRVTAKTGEVINPLTTSGKILTQGGVLATTYPEWVAEYMLSSYLVPLPLSLSNAISFLFPETTQAYYDALIEPLVTRAHPKHLKAALPASLVPAAFVAGDLALSAGFFGFALASPVSAVAAIAVIAAAKARK